MASGDLCLLDTNILLRISKSDDLLHATIRHADVIERDFELLPDSRDVHERWRSLLVALDVKGVQVHDARLAASMADSPSGPSILRRERATGAHWQWEQRREEDGTELPGCEPAQRTACPYYSTPRAIT